MITVTAESFPLTSAFTIARGSRSEARVLSVHITRNGVTGRGECTPYPRYGESEESVTAQILSLPGDITRIALQRALPPGAARNAVDCALWDHEAKRTGRRVWELAGLPPPRPVASAYTLSLDTPEAMGRAAARNAGRPLLKLKLGGEGDLARLEAVRHGAPGARLIIDANEGWDIATYRRRLPRLAALGVALIEQPLPAGADAELAGLPRPVALCADESCHTRADLGRLAGLYDVVNVKLDKAGGLTEALALADAARTAGFGVMAGCMLGSSLGVAPAVLVAQGAAFADLDPPMLLSRDREHALACDGANVHPPAAALWG